MTTLQAFIVGVAVGTTFMLATALILRGHWKARGYALGHASRQDYIETLLDISANHRERATQLEQQHSHDRAALILDADQRIAHYARRANPFTERHQQDLAGIAAVLDLAAATFAGLQANDKAMQARSGAITLRQMGEQLGKVIAAQEAPAQQEAPINDTALIEFLDQYGDFWADDEETGDIRFPVKAPHEGFQHIRDVLLLAIQQQAEQQAQDFGRGKAA